MPRGVRRRGPLSIVLLVAWLGVGPLVSRAGDPFAPAPDDLAARRRAALDRGVAWLLAQQQASGAFASRPLPGTPRLALEIGEHALATWALATARRGDEHAPALHRALGLLRRVAPRLLDPAPGSGAPRTTYAIAATLCALAAGESGPRWMEGAIEPCRDRALRNLARALVQHLVAAQHRYGGIRYPGARGERIPATVDTSNSAWFARALVAARRLGAPADWEPVRRLGLACATWQEPAGEPVLRSARAVPRGVVPAAEAPGPSRYEAPDGSAVDHARGVGYLTREAVPHYALPTASGDLFAARGGTTCSGVIIWAMALDEGHHAAALSADDQSRFEACVWDALGWMGLHFEVRREPGSERAGGWLVAYLADLSLAMRLLGVGRLAGHDWFREGSEELLRTQAPAGWWNPDDTMAGGLESSLVGRLRNTAFALLFLGLEPVAPARPTLTGLPPP